MTCPRAVLSGVINKKTDKKVLDFLKQRCYNAQANFVGTLVLCPFAGCLYTGMATRNTVSQSFGIRCVAGAYNGNGLRRKGELL